MSRRLERLETRAAIIARDKSFSIRIRFVHPEHGVTGVLLLETGKDNRRVPVTAEDQESVRESMRLRRETSNLSGAAMPDLKRRSQRLERARSAVSDQQPEMLLVVMPAGTRLDDCTDVLSAAEALSHPPSRGMRLMLLWSELKRAW